MDVDSEILLLQSLDKLRLVGRVIRLYSVDMGFSLTGIHKHFRMIALYNRFNKTSPTRATTSELWDYVNSKWAITVLDEMVFI